MFFKILKNSVGILVLIVLVYIFRGPIGDKYTLLYAHFFPCTKPIAYSIGSFDTRFGISKTEFIATIHQAESIWEKVAGKELFTYTTDGSLKINLVYDYRQESTEKLRALGLAVDDSKSSYDTIKARYTILQASYTKQKEDFQALLTLFESQKKTYDTEVAYWNARGGAPRQEYEKMQAEKVTLVALQDQIKTAQDTLNKVVDDINSLVTVLNRLASTLNISVTEYNTIGKTTAAEFEEGLYHSSLDGTGIDIYQFDTKNKLVRVLTHELGHALGLEHVDDPKAIMYRLNQASTLTPSQADISLLKQRCGIK